LRTRLSIAGIQAARRPVISAESGTFDPRMGNSGHGHPHRLGRQTTWGATRRSRLDEAIRVQNTLNGAYNPTGKT